MFTVKKTSHHQTWQWEIHPGTKKTFLQKQCFPIAIARSDDPMPERASLHGECESNRRTLTITRDCFPKPQRRFSHGIMIWIQQVDVSSPFVIGQPSPVESRQRLEHMVSIFVYNKFFFYLLPKNAKTWFSFVFFVSLYIHV